MERIAVGKILQGLRKAKGITQEQLSEVLGVSTAAISKWENEQMYPDISYFPILARFFNVSIDCLFGFTNDLSEQEYEDNLNECVELFKTGNYEKGLEKIKYLTYLFPTNDRLRVNLTSAVIPYLALAENQNLRREIALNLVELCQVCVDKELQVQKHFILAHLFMLTGQYQEAATDAIIMSKNAPKGNIDISNGLMLKAEIPNTIDRINSSIEILSTQIIYELRNKISYLQKENNLEGALALLMKQVDLVELLELGNCGYSVRPSERNKGYASEILKQICALAKEHGLANLQLSVERENTASIKTILRNGGCYSRSFKFGNEEADVYSINLSSGKQFELAKEPQASSHFMKKKSNVKER